MARCERQSSGLCDWVHNDASRACLANGGIVRPVDKIDLLLVIGNGNTSREPQLLLAEQLASLSTRLIGASRDLRVGVVSADLGTPGSSVPGCQSGETGDDGLLNPIRHGQALAHHEPWITGYAQGRPTDCITADEFPSFITFSSSMDPARFAHDMACNAIIGGYGCGLQAPLEAIWRALIWHPVGLPPPGNTHPNAGFLREDALLAILVVHDREDASVRDCRYAQGASCSDALDVYDAASDRWASANLSSRFLLYQPGDARDPTWSLDRYIDPIDASRGLLGLKPGHPERVIFGAILGVPLETPMVAGHTDWNALLGTPSPASPNGFNARDSTTAIQAVTAEGPISMRQANPDPSCPERVVPACRREGSAYDPAHPPCVNTEQYSAPPGRRLTEVARRFDEARLCAGERCGNGMVYSACHTSWRDGIADFADRVIARLR